MTAPRDDSFAQYVSGRLPSLRRLAFMLCHDWHGADDLVQAAITRLYVQWTRATAADNLDSYVRTILVREFLHERRTGWARRVSLTADLPLTATVTADRDMALDLRAAIACLPPGQRAVLVLRFYCDLSVEQSAQVLGCSTGNVKSQTARALAALRASLGADWPLSDCEAGATLRRSHGEVTDNA